MNGFESLFGNTTKSVIVEMLTEKPLTLKEIHYKLGRFYSIKQSLQATHKALKQLIMEETLIKKDKKYLINPEWVENYRKNAEQLSKKISTETKEINLTEMNEGETIHLKCKGILEVGWLLVDKIMIAPNPERKPAIALWRFCYSVVGLEEKHLTGLKKACKQNNWHVFVEENNKVDQMFGETLLAYGMKSIKYGVKCATPLSDKMIIGDYVTELIYPSMFRKLWAIQNRLPKKILEFKLAKHLLLMREIQPDIEIIITKNAKLAEEYRKEYFGGGWGLKYFTKLKTKNNKH